MNSLEEIKRILELNKLSLEREFRVREIGIFGSYVRGEQRDKSDLDILVDFNKPISFFTFLALEDRLEALLGVKIDLVSKKALKPNIGKNILQEVVPI